MPGGKSPKPRGRRHFEMRAVRATAHPTTPKSFTAVLGDRERRQSRHSNNEGGRRRSRRARLLASLYKEFPCLSEIRETGVQCVAELGTPLQMLPDGVVQRRPYGRASFRDALSEAALKRESPQTFRALIASMPLDSSIRAVQRNLKRRGQLTSVGSIALKK